MSASQDCLLIGRYEGGSGSIDEVGSSDSRTAGGSEILIAEPCTSWLGGIPIPASMTSARAGITGHIVSMLGLPGSEEDSPGYYHGSHLQRHVRGAGTRLKRQASWECCHWSRGPVRRGFPFGHSNEMGGSGDDESHVRQRHRSEAGFRSLVDMHAGKFEPHFASSCSRIADGRHGRRRFIKMRWHQASCCWRQPPANRHIQLHYVQFFFSK